MLFSSGKDERKQLAEKGKTDHAVRELLDLCDLLVDGPYVEAQRDLTLQYRGSANQRLIKNPGKLL